MCINYSIYMYFNSLVKIIIMKFIIYFTLVSTLIISISRFSTQLMRYYNFPPWCVETTPKLSAKIPAPYKSPKIVALDV